jgi:hypothetical protein
MRDVFIWKKYRHEINYIFWYALCFFKYFTYQLVPVLAAKNKQHILSPAEVSFFSLSQHAE